MGVESSLPQEAAAQDLLGQARIRLKPPVRAERLWPALAAAAFFAVAAVTFAVASIMAPAWSYSPPTKAGVR